MNTFLFLDFRHDIIIDAENEVDFIGDDDRMFYVKSKANLFSLNIKNVELSYYVATLDYSRVDPDMLEFPTDFSNFIR